MSHSRCQLSIIIVSWNIRELLLSCIESIIRNFSNVSYEIIVVDNASTDNTIEAVVGNYKISNLKIINSPINLGFSKGNEKGIEIAEGEAILILNPDTVILNRNIDILIKRLWSDETLAIIGCRILNQDLTVQKTCARYLPTLKRKIYDFIFMADYNKLFNGKGQYYVDEFYEKEGYVECISGCFMLVKKDIIDRISLFDHSYFMYAEDIEFCHRINKNKYKILYMPQMEIVHYGGMSAAQRHESSFGTIKKYESDIYLFSKIYNYKTATYLRLIILIGSTLRLSALYALKQLSSKNNIWLNVKINKHIDVIKKFIF